MIANFYSSGGGGGASSTPNTFLPPPPPISGNISVRIVERKVLSLTDVNNKFYDLSERPIDPFDVLVNFQGYTDFFYNYDFAITHNGVDFRRVSWAGKPAELAASVGLSTKYVYDSDLSIGPDGKIVRYYPVTPAIVAAKQISLPIKPQNYNEVEFNVKGYGDFVHTQDYVVAGLTLSWASKPPELVISVGDVIRVVYYADVASASAGYAMETITITPAMITDQGVDLSFLPKDPLAVEVSLEGFTDSTVGSDYEIIFSPTFLDDRFLSWAGKSLDLAVAPGLDLKINYNY